MNRIAIFASGSGSNAENLIQFFKNDKKNQIVAVYCNKSDAGVLGRAKRLNVPSFIFSKKEMLDGLVLKQLKKDQINFIVLAGFLLQLPKEIIEKYHHTIVNIHPALLPKYGGKGMYGMYVHQAVKENNETETGITIHYVNENYDEGAIIFQKSVAVLPSDTPESIAHKIHELEYEYFPSVVKNLLNSF
jgi:phosphoribosylglycinamide formyltransferase 1